MERRRRQCENEHKNSVCPLPRPHSLGRSFRSRGAAHAMDGWSPSTVPPHAKLGLLCLVGLLVVWGALDLPGLGIGCKRQIGGWHRKCQVADPPPRDPWEVLVWLFFWRGCWNIFVDFH